ncbi:hypothetical protein PR202_gb25082 [Eleusine coracana subsp. coracana]|uniref:Kinesin-like protein n=1 Tax=Eleusine coracana subsp. coracana TaxID=191504 RepID=A0AAV5FP79_ELECO|nr:hypothetical protein PR202_gb25082 [Eleusine coracana subsp. coracana]
MEKRNCPPSPSPRSTEKSGRDLRSGDSNGGTNTNSNTTTRGEKGVNVQVILRCRPLSDEETKSNTPVVISCNERRREVAATQIIANKQIDRTFAFDKVFGPSSKQKDLFEQSISPIVNEVLEGYNCTIFAYGQTGTGKTYTMEGGGTRKTKNGELPTDAGVIPRAVRQIFDILEAQCAEYSMKVTFLELYNEEITDLLAPEEPKFPVPEDKTKKPIALMEDGKGFVFVRGLEEEIVYSAGEIYKILDKGSAKRRTAETLLNKQSSRSHSIFSITIHIKELTHEGEEMIKIGKLNLVDLAGSENISRSGARDGRAREAGEINKSLLTLGRVINALVEHSGHVPYRKNGEERRGVGVEGGDTSGRASSSLWVPSPAVIGGGRRAWVAAGCLAVVLVALGSPPGEATRGRLLKPGLCKDEISGKQRLVNQRMMKSAMIKDLYYEIDRLKQEVFAAREKNGIYIPRERYLQEEAEKKAMTEKIERLGVDLEARDKQLVELKELYDAEQLLSAELGEKLGKTQSAQGLKESVQKLKILHGSGITALDNLAGEIDMNSRTTFEKLNSQVQSHTSALEKCFGGIASEADNLLNELQCSLSKQEERLAHFAKKQREGHLRAVEASRSISKITAGFFHSLDIHASKLSNILEDTQSVQNQQLLDLEKKFEECAANEEKQLLEKVAEMLASSNARKKQLVQTAVGSLRESAVNHSGEEWGVYMEETEKNYIEDTTATTAIDTGRSCLAEVLVECKGKDKHGCTTVEERRGFTFQPWQRKHGICGFYRQDRNRNQPIAAFQVVIFCSLKLDHDACANISSILTPCHEEMGELKGEHHSKVVEITENAGKCLEEEYLVDEPSCSTPRRRQIDLPSVESIEELRTPDYDELLKSFQQSRGSWKQANGDMRHFSQSARTNIAIG